MLLVGLCHICLSRCTVQRTKQTDHSVTKHAYKTVVYVTDSLFDIYGPMGENRGKEH